MTEQSIADDGPKSIRGWLLLFCLGMTVNPLVGIRGAILGVSILKDQEVPAAVLVVYCGLRFAVLGLGLYSAILLWTRHRKAVVITKCCLVLYAISWALLALAPAVLPADVQTEVSLALFRIYQKRLPGVLLSSSIWFAYLCRSKRVANTYAAAPQEGYA
jgi:hypothetical protein